MSVLSAPSAGRVSGRARNRTRCHEQPARTPPSSGPERAAATGRSAAAQYHLEGVHPAQSEIVLPHDVRGRASGITVSHADPASQMIRRVGGLRTTGVEATLLRLIDELDAAWPSRSTLEVKTRHLLVPNGLTDFTREFPLDWNGCTYRFDFAFEAPRTILETNGPQWHDDATDYERDNAKWSVPGCHGYRLLLATWDRVTRHPEQFLGELVTTLAA